MGANPLLETSDGDSIPGKPDCFPSTSTWLPMGVGALPTMFQRAQRASPACSESWPCPALLPGIGTPGRVPGARGWELFTGDNAGTLVLCLYKLPPSRCTFLAGLHLLTSRCVSLCRGGSHELPSREGPCWRKAGMGRLSPSSEMWLPKLFPAGSSREVGWHPWVSCLPQGGPRRRWSKAKR